MYNLIAYILYLLITYLVTVHVGMIFYKYGRYYMLNLFIGDEALTSFINKILLTGYYLLNLGYAALMIRIWENVQSFEQLIASIATMVGRIIITLAMVHYMNMAVILIISKRKSINHH